MSRIIEKTVFNFNELSDSAKEAARNWYRDGMDYEFCWETTVEDAEQIGLEIKSLEDHRANKGAFTQSAHKVALAILANHGAMCATYGTARDYLITRHKHNADDADFLHSLLEDYRIMLNNEIEYQQSSEAVDESIDCNGYEFDEKGRIA